MLLTLGEPYTAHITWTNNGIAIAGETQTTLVVTETGNYSASAAPGICPDYVLDLGVTIPVYFTPNAQPAIVADAGQLCVYPTGNST
ncbi:MAG TPA: hypothetical protein VKG92_05345, partial [Flavobacteriales bacterium]|nr:hypothetical protein [Flavobacteriales bacterium]